MCVSVTLDTHKTLANTYMWVDNLSCDHMTAIHWTPLTVLCISGTLAKHYTLTNTPVQIGDLCAVDIEQWNDYGRMCGSHCITSLYNDVITHYTFIIYELLFT